MTNEFFISLLVLNDESQGTVRRPHPHPQPLSRARARGAEPWFSSVVLAIGHGGLPTSYLAGEGEEHFLVVNVYREPIDEVPGQE